MSEEDQNRGLNQCLRALPSVGKILDQLPGVPHAIACDVARATLEEARQRIRSGHLVTTSEIVAHALERSANYAASVLTPVINATGVMIHTNLGRVPLSDEQIDAVRRAARSYSNLEYDLVLGGRADRYAHARSSIAALTGAESAVVVNNNAAAVLVTLAALCSSKEVIVSRGELIEIGGGFRIPDVMVTSGATLVEVGTTNRTRLADYEGAISPDTAAILKVHPSNYRIVGFTGDVETRDLGQLARERGVLLVHDLGSGLIEHSNEGWTSSEPRVAQAIDFGADIVTFSGDKLLGGPQAGIVAGRKLLIDRIARHPLMRVVRPDKMTLAALEATLTMHLEGRSIELPLWRMASEPSLSIKKRASALAKDLSRLVPDLKAEVCPVASVSGGGSLPLVELPSWAVALMHPEVKAAEMQRSLRGATPPVIARIVSDVLLLDLRTVEVTQELDVKAAVVGLFT